MILKARDKCLIVILFVVLLTNFINKAYSQAENQYIKQAKEALEAGDKGAASKAYYNAANDFLQNNQPEKALPHLKEALRLAREIANPGAVHTFAAILGFIHNDLEQYDDGIKMFELAYEQAKILGDSNKQGEQLLNIANTYSGIENYVESIKYYLGAAHIYQNLEDFPKLAKIYLSLSQNCASIGRDEEKEKYYTLYQHYEKKISAEEVVKIKKESQSKVAVVSKKKNKVIQEQKELLKAAEDSLKDSHEKQKEKERRIRRLNRQKSLDDLTIQQQETRLEYERRISYILGLVLLIVIVFLIFVIRMYRQKKKLNDLLHERTNEIIKQKEILEKQAKQLELSNRQVQSGILYAQRIQTSMLPLQDSMDKLFDSFTIYRPKDIVSGDFYWMTHLPGSDIQKDKILVAAVDCTGHGVPGAFMSMIGNRLLNEIVKEKQIHMTNIILDLLFHGTVESLNQEHTANRDGMDLCLCLFEKQDDGTTKVSFSGARRPLIIYHRKEKKTEIIKGDKRSVGRISSAPIKKDVKFSINRIILEKDDIVYLGSDGITDQNNPARERFGTQRLIKLIDENGHKPLLEQKRIIEDEFDKFRDRSVQRDDVLLIGINAGLNPSEEKIVRENIWKGRKVLIAEDQDLNFAILEGYMQLTGAIVTRAFNGKDAVEKFEKQGDFDLVLMDINMPLMNGIKATTEIRKLDKKIPIVIQTAYNTSDEKNQSIDAGCSNFISKPIQSIELYKILDKYLHI